MMDCLWLAITILVGLVAGAFFSGMETGLISLNRVRLRHEVERQNRRALILHGFVENTERLLSTTLAGTNLCNVMVAVASSALALRLFGANVAIDLTTTLISAAVVLVLSEIVPKVLFRKYSHRLCLTCADALNAVAWSLAPLVWFLGVLMRALSRLSGRSDDKPHSF